MSYLKKFVKNIPRPVFWGSVIGTVCGAALLTKEQIGGVRYHGYETSNPKGKVIIITGANTGLGKETAWELARRGAKVYMACRDLKRCETAREEIVLDTKNQYVYCRRCDLASLQSIREFAKMFKEKEDTLDVLINNAGVMKPPQGKTHDGFELQLGINHMGHFLLTNLLLDVLKKSAPARVINVTCTAYKTGKINKEDLNSDKSYNGATAYSQSKVANVLFTKELAIRLQGTGVTVNCVYPGLSDTDLTRHTSFYSSWLSSIFLKPFLWPFLKNPKQGAQTIIYLAIDDRVKDITGMYFSNYEQEPYTSAGVDLNTQKWLWAVSEKWTQYKEPST